MKTFLVCCNHEKKTYQVESADTARQSHVNGCRLCAGLVNDVRVYQWGGQPIHSQRLKETQARSPDEQDWIDEMDSVSK